MTLGIFSIFDVAVFSTYLTSALLLAWRGRRSLPNSLLILTAVLTGVWGGAIAAGGTIWIISLAALSRDAAWLLTIIALLRQDTRPGTLWKYLTTIVFLLLLCDFVLLETGAHFNSELGMQVNLATAMFATYLLGLILLENLVRNITPARLWSLKLMIIGLCCTFGYNLLSYIPKVLGDYRVTLLDLTQPLIYLAALPLFVVTAVRNNSLGLNVHSSRHVVFHSAMLIFSGLLLEGTAASALYLRNFGGPLAMVLSIALGFTGVLGVLILASSASVRSWVRNFINQNFFTYKYDYRVEWKRFVIALAEQETLGGPERALRILINLLDSTGGALWVKRKGWQQFLPLAHQSVSSEFGPIRSEDDVLQSLMSENVVFIELTTDGTCESAIWKQRFPKAWLVVPLRFRREVIAFAILQKPRAARRLCWEDRELVSLVALQLATYLVHEETIQALTDSQQMAEFNQRVTFAVHDLKNTAGQMHLLADNAERFGSDAQFRRDMTGTLHHAARNLEAMVAKLRRESSKDSTKPTVIRLVNIRATLSKLLEKMSADKIVFEDHLGSKPVYVAMSDPDIFNSAIGHVVDNALEASPLDLPVRLTIETEQGRVFVRIADQGPGMSAEFIEQQLFRPLRTTKLNGMGIGAYQARALMRDLGGDLEVQSAIGGGTIVTLHLPRCDHKALREVQ